MLVDRLWEGGGPNRSGSRLGTRYPRVVPMRHNPGLEDASPLGLGLCVGKTGAQGWEGELDLTPAPLKTRRPREEGRHQAKNRRAWERDGAGFCDLSGGLRAPYHVRRPTGPIMVTCPGDLSCPSEVGTGFGMLRVRRLHISLAFIAPFARNSSSLVTRAKFAKLAKILVS